MNTLENAVHAETKEGFDIYFQPMIEDLALSDTFDDSVHNLDEIATKIDNGDYVYFCAHVWVEKKGFNLADDYLGSCLYDSFEDFYIKYHDDYFIDMVNTVISEAKRSIELLTDKGGE